MPCVLNSGRLLQCKDKIGGIKTIFIAEHSKFVTGIQINADTPSTEEITALPDLTPVIELFRYELSQAAGDFVETITARLRMVRYSGIKWLTSL